MAAGVSITSHLWDIQGKKVAGYIQTLTSGTVAQYVPSTTETTSLYWVNGGTHRVTYTATLSNGGQVSNFADIDVRRPTATFNGITTTIPPVINFAVAQQADKTLNFGHKPAGTTEDPKCRDDAGELPGVSQGLPGTFGEGKLRLVQVINTLRRATKDDNSTIDIVNSQGSFWLDVAGNQIAYSGLEYDLPTGQSGTLTNESFDFPWQGVLPDDKVVTITESFRMYVMYRPSGDDSIFVSLKVIPWNWGAVLSKTGAAWADEQPTMAEWATNPQGVDPVTNPIDPGEQEGLSRWTGRTP